MRAAGVNFADIMARLGLYPDAPKPPVVVGYEVAGVVDAVGRGVTGFRDGDRVVALTHFGGYATQAVVPAGFAFAIPDALSAVDAAAIPVNYLTAYLALYRLANVTAGETVLIHGAGGGVGIAATQLARLRGATILGTASSAKHDAIRREGVDHAIDYRQVDVVSEVRRLTRDRGVDVVLDPLGGASFKDSYRLLAPFGRLVVYGVSSLATGERRKPGCARWTTIVWMPRFSPLSMMRATCNRGVFGLNLGPPVDEEREKLADAMRELLLGSRTPRSGCMPIVARTFPLDQAADAHRFVQSRSNIGKVVLTIRGRGARG